MITGPFGEGVDIICSGSGNSYSHMILPSAVLTKNSFPGCACSPI